MTNPHRPLRWMVLALAVVLTGLIAWRVTAHFAGSPSEGARLGNTSLRVDAVRVSRQPVPLLVHASGFVQTHHSVAVEAQASGVLEKVLFNEGDVVKAGQLLFVIDPRPYEVKVAQAKGQVEQAQAKLAADQANAKRVARLVGRGYVSSQKVQDAKALVAQDKGALSTYKASLAQAQLQLSYTRIQAPIAGKTGELAFKAGNLVQTNGATPLVTINQISPILVQFEIPQSQLDLLMRYRDDPALNIFVRSPSGQLVAQGGKLVFVDNLINRNTGTLSLKAKFANAEDQLWPGELVRVSLQLTVQPNLVVVPITAVQPGQKGDYVFLVKNGKVAVRNVQVLREYGNYAVIDSGLESNEVVVTHIPRNLREGLAVSTHMIPNVTVARCAASAPKPAASATGASG